MAARRIRRLLAWRGATTGFALASFAALVLAFADWRRWIWVEWPMLAALVGFGALAGLVAGLLRRLPDSAVAASLDRRAGLKDRLASSMEISAAGHPYADAVATNARAALEGIDPRRLYPLRFNRWHTAALLCGLLAALFALLGNTPFMRSLADRKDQDEMKKQAQEVERIAKPVLEDKDVSKLSEEYAKQLQQFARELDRARHDKKDALKKTNDLLSQGQDLQRELSKKVNTGLERAQQSIEKMLAAKLAERGISASPEEIRKQMDNLLRPDDSAFQKALEANRDERAGLDAARKDLKAQMDELRKQMSKMAEGSPEQKAMKEMLDELQAKMKGLDEMQKDLANQMRQAQEDFRNQLMENAGDPGEFEKQLAEAQRELDKIEAKLKMPNLTDAQRKAMEEKAKALRELMKQLKMSKELQEGLKALYSDPKMKEIMKRMAELMAKAKFAEGEAGEPGEMPKLTPEDIAEMQRMLDEMAEMLSDPAFRQEMLDALKEALENLDELTLSQGMCFGLGMCMMPGMMTPVGSATHGGAFSDINWVNKLDKPEKGGGKTLPARVSGERHPELGRETFVETRGPARLGAPSKVPYLNILPKYRQAMEDAMKKQQIPKDQEKRVRDYFRSIGGQ